MSLPASTMINKSSEPNVGILKKQSRQFADETEYGS
jgi:hypothetical protein